MALGDLLFSMMGQPDPRAQVAQSLGMYPGQAGSRSGPVPGPGAGAAAPGLAQQGGAQGVPGQPPQQQPQAPPQPQAYTSPPDLAQSYLKLMQRQQANEGINTGFGLLAGAFSHNQADRSEMINAMSGLNAQQAASGIGGGGGGLGGIAELINTQRQMQMQNYMMGHINEGAKALGITPDMYLNGYMTGKLGDIVEKQFESGLPLNKAQVQETLSRTNLALAQAGAIPATIAKTQAETAAIPAHTALETAQAGAIPSTIAKTQAETGAIPAHTALETAQAGAIPADIALKQAEAKKATAEATGPTEALRNYNFAVSQIPQGQKVPTFDEWQAQSAGLKEAATQTNLLQTQQKMSAQAALPDAVAKIREQLANADSIVDDPSLNNVTGALGGNLGHWLAQRGGPGATLQSKIDMLAGASGVSAVESLKGVGRILGTEYEAGTEAQSRLKDQQIPVADYKTAVREYANKLRSQLAIVTQKSGAAVPKDLQSWLPNAAGKIPGLELQKIPAGAIEMLKKDPSMREFFDHKYGAGMSDTALGQ